MSVFISWTNPNAEAPTEEEVRVYRSETPIDTNNPPPVLATLSPGVTSYEDTTAVDGTVYFYVVSFVRGALVEFSNQKEVRAPADFPGSPGLPLPPVNSPYGAVVSETGETLFNTDGDRIRTNAFSMRKLLAAVVILEEKGDVLDTELVTVTSGDISTTGGEWLSGLQDGDQLTWKDILDLMLVPSKSDIAATAERVLGQELLEKYGRGDTTQRSFGYWMTHVAGRAGAYRTIAFSNQAGSVSGEVVSSNIIAPPRDVPLWIQMVSRYPELVDIIDQPEVTINVQGPNPRTINWPSMDHLKNIRDTSGTLMGVGVGAPYIGGKTGDSGTTGHQCFACETGSGDTVYGVVYEAGSRELRAMDVLRVMMSVENFFPFLRGPENVLDPYRNFVELRTIGEEPIVDLSNHARTLTSSGVSEVVSQYMSGSALRFSGAGYVRSDNPINLGTKDFTIEAFLRGNSGSPGSTMEVVGQWRTSTGLRSWAIQIQSNTARFYYSGDGTANAYASAAFPGGTANLWNGSPVHLCAIRDGSQLRMFVNGVPGPLVNLPAGFSFNVAPTPLIIGARRNSGDTAYENHLTADVEEVIVTPGIVRYPTTGFLPRYRPARWDDMADVPVEEPVEEPTVIAYSAPGTYTWDVPAGVTEVEVLVVAGGGGGGGNGPGGGGGAGGLIHEIAYAVSGSISITVGAGGAGGTTNSGQSGQNSEFGNLVCVGGGAGGGFGDLPGKAGGSGGGGGGRDNNPGGSGTVGQGNDGGNARDGGSSSNNAAGGGGGFSAVGGKGGSDLIGGDGGDGYDASAAFGTLYGLNGTFAGGGGGGSDTASGFGAGKAGGGDGGNGNGSSGATTGGDAANGSGSGGGGGGNQQNGGRGGDGVVLIKLP